MNTYAQWLKDIPFQFKEGLHNRALIKAFSRQLDELNEAIIDVIWKTDIDTAEGYQLDMIGDIVNITRQEAYQLLDPDYITDVDDEIFRAVLKFKVLKNNTDGTYDDIVKGLHFLWDYAKAKITYEDNPWDKYRNRYAPATILLGVNDIPSDAPDPLVIKPMVIKPGGVKIDLTVSYKDDLFGTDWERFANVRITIEEGYFYDGAYYETVGGKLYYDGSIEYHPSSYSYNRFDGEYQFNGEIYWGPIIHEYEEYVMDCVFLKQAKRKTLKLRARGDAEDWRIAYMVWGDGLSNTGGAYTPDEEQEELKNELLRKEIALVYKEDENTWTYQGYIGSDELNGKYISEVGLADTDGMLICIKTFPKKFKQEGRQMVFKIDDTLTPAE